MDSDNLRIYTRERVVLLPPFCFSFVLIDFSLNSPARTRPTRAGLRKNRKNVPESFSTAASSQRGYLVS